MPAPAPTPVVTPTLPIAAPAPSTPPAAATSPPPKPAGASTPTAQQVQSAIQAGQAALQAFGVTPPAVPAAADVTSVDTSSDVAAASQLVDDATAGSSDTST
jgi:hypothetical protein